MPSSNWSQKSQGLFSKRLVGNLNRCLMGGL
jgi:hypothetical protein